MNDELMTKSEARNPSDADDLFWNEDTELIVREEPAKSVCDLEERTARFGEAVIDFRKTDSARCSHESRTGVMRRPKPVRVKILRHSSFGIPSCFGIRISSF